MGLDIGSVLLLAIIQGLTEFLPVSSSGHLVIAQAVMGARTPGSGSVIFETAVHAGTLGAVVYHYRERVARLASAAGRLISGGLRSRGSDASELRYIGLFALGSVPAAAVGLFLHDRIIATFDAPAVAAGCLVATGIYLLFSKGRGGTRELGWRTALLIGAAQAVAILPGCSRSGWTITTALLCGVGFAEAAEFSFVLSIPAVAGALALELAGSAEPLTRGEAGMLAVGAAAAFASGLLALRLLIRILRSGCLHRFAWYLFPVGGAGVLWFLLAG
ncbi:MAG: undecaprenyl-diphosphate phosphatase [Candidatus Krumholzibacteria bacterium]|nr:undecaprenyl-diphosphate phosphatase [Candidatus Krumholzibacteria bacterium]